LDLWDVHSKAVRANNETEAVRRVHAESTLLDFGVWGACLKALQDLVYIFDVLDWVVKVDQDVI